ncbi:hypothetical protein ON058_05120 [Demequina sp. B12]|uniref:hypothetical protein n=1 Tax=Demequina sp. B12 TaxID=2992757 RepID=UPI00237B3817|nr:hypothetical protein [Demequina sp. B12]MDE0572794.1 hypothetical protein [Demequina sp. B12]
MTDQERPHSRRERRAREQREAHRLDDTAPLEPGLDTHGIPMETSELRAISRRERRRMERLEHPVETWTAEEEMIATGQIPAMTPERIAEQEKIARDKAAAAQRDAQTASDEIAQVRGAVSPQAPNSGAPVASPESASPRRSSLIPDTADPAGTADSAPAASQSWSAPQPQSAPHVASAPAAPSAPREPATSQPLPPAQSPQHPTSQHQSPQSPSPQSPSPQSQPMTAATPVNASGPASVVSAPPAEPASAPASASAPAAPSAPAQEPARPLGMPPGMTPEMFDMLFPPGSAQRRLMERQASGEAAESAGSSLTAPSAYSAASAPAATSHVSAPSAASAPAPSAPSQAAPSAPSAPMGAQPQAPSAPQNDDGPLYADDDAAPSGGYAAGTYDQWGGHHSVPSAASAPAYDHQSPAPQPSYDTRADEPQYEAPAQQPTPAPNLEPWEPAESSGESTDLQSGTQWGFSSDDEDGPGHDSLTPGSGAEPSFDAILGAPSAGEAASQWDSHPLMTAEVPAVTGQIEVDVDREQLESEALPLPDLSNVRTSTFQPAAHVDPVETGNFEIEPREKPELHPAGGRHHFGWAQLAVIGAVAFVLGVIVWNVLKGN